MAPNKASQNPPSSYKGVYKYPTKRDELIYGNGQDWLDAKKVDDNIGDLWRVHDKLYNLTDFIKKHPGGSDWISMTRGTDITEAFESSHVINVKKVESILNKHYVRPAEHPRMSPNTFKPSGFYLTLKRKVEPILKEVGTGPTIAVRAFIDSVFLSWALVMYVGVTWESRLLQVLGGLVLALGVIAAHNFYHVKQNWRMYYWDLSLLSSYEWRITHSLSHHCFANTIMDAEISMFEPVIELLPKKNKHFIQRYLAVAYLPFTYLGMFYVAMIPRWKNVITGKQSFRPEFLLCLSEIPTFIYLAPTWQSGLLAWFIMQSSFSFLFLTIGLHAAHHHPSIFHDGDEPISDPDFGLIQIDAVRDRAENIHKNLFVQLVTFGDHVLHHLFPTVCHSKLHYIEGVYEETAREFSVKYPALTSWELYSGVFQQIRRTEPTERNKKTQ